LLDRVNRVAEAQLAGLFCWYDDSVVSKAVNRQLPLWQAIQWLDTLKALPSARQNGTLIPNPRISVLPGTDRGAVWNFNGVIDILGARLFDRLLF
jgi:hypothetical protein